MTIDWTAFTPWSALAGGAMIGAAALLFAVLAGRIAGISGIVGGMLRPARGDFAWRAAFVAGLVAVPLFLQAARGGFEVDIQTSDAILVVAGLLVGFGSRLGSGCTSGHGVCGLARRSPRSLVATLVFMGAGFVTVAITRHLA